MKKSIVIYVLAVSLSLFLSACAPGQYSNPTDTRPKVVIFDSPSDSQIRGLKKVLYAVLNANDASQPFNVLGPGYTDYYEENGSIRAVQAEYYGSLATRRLDADLAVLIHAPVLERYVYKEAADKDKDGFEDVTSQKRIVVTKLQLEAFILDPVAEERLVTYTSHVYESSRVEYSSQQLVLTEEDPDVWKMANIALREFAPLVAQDLGNNIRNNISNNSRNNINSTN